jgi:hypothetical protein
LPCLHTAALDHFGRLALLLSGASATAVGERLDGDQLGDDSRTRLLSLTGRQSEGLAQGPRTEPIR